MLLFAVTILFNTAFSLFVRGAQRHGHDAVAVGVVNYTFASLCFWVFTAVSHTSYASLAVQIGLIGGCLYVTTYFLLLPAMNFKGVAVSMAVVRLSVLVPLLGAVLIWGETPGMVKTLGIALALVALPMLTFDHGADSPKFDLRHTTTLAGLFIFNGACLLVGKWFQTTQLIAERPLYLATLFSIAALLCLVYWMCTRRHGMTTSELRWGLAAGASNAISNFLILYVLDLFLASVVFPVLAAVALSLATAFAAFVWDEKLGRLGWAGIGIAVVAIVLANL